MPWSVAPFARFSRASIPFPLNHCQPFELGRGGWPLDHNQGASCQWWCAGAPGRQGARAGVKRQYLKEGDQKHKDEPDINHLDVRGLWKPLRHGDEHGDKHQHHSEVNDHSGLKEEGLEKVGEVGYDDQQDGRNVGGQNGSKQSPEQFSFDLSWNFFMNDYLPSTTVTSTSFLTPRAMLVFLMKYCVRSLGPVYSSPDNTSSTNSPELPSVWGRNVCLWQFVERLWLTSKTIPQDCVSKGYHAISYSQIQSTS